MGELQEVVAGPHNVGHELHGLALLEAIRAGFRTRSDRAWQVTRGEDGLVQTGRRSIRVRAPPAGAVVDAPPGMRDGRPAWTIRRKVW